MGTYESNHTTSKGAFYIGIDFHEHYSVFCVIDERNMVLDRGRIEHKIPVGFEHLLKRYPGCRAVFETTMNWHWLYEFLEAHMDHKDIVLANAYRIRILAEAQVKTDKVDAYMLATFLKAELISTVHIPSKRTAREEFFCLVIFKGQEPGKYIVRSKTFGIDLISAEGEKQRRKF